MSDGIEEFDMGEFSLDTEPKKNPNEPKFLASQKEDLKDRDISKKMIRKEMKEVVKIIDKPSQEKLQDHQSKVIMLSRYGTSKRFGEYLKSMGFNLAVSHLKKLDTEELDEMLVRVKTSIDNKNISDFWGDLAFGLIQTGEVLTVSTSLGKRLKIQGLTDVLKGDEVFLDLLEQIELENQNLVYTSPYIRLVYAVATSAMKVHSVNTMMEKRLKIHEKEVEVKEDEVKEEVKEDEVREEVIVEEKEKPSLPKGVISFEE
jgi:hypothetical protein